MSDFDMIYDLKSYQFVHQETGFVLHAEDVMMYDNSQIIADILAGTGVEVDDLYIDVLRDTIELREPKFPW